MESTAFTQEEKATIQRRTAKSLLWVGIVSIIMLFAGLTSGYIVRQAEGDWLVIELPTSFWYSTLLILISSATMWWAHRGIKKGDIKTLQLGLVLTLVLGVAFVAAQFKGWAELIASGIYMTGPNANVAGSFLYVIPALHLIHVFFGILCLAYTRVKAGNGDYTAQEHLGVDMMATYWHFMDTLWVYLFFFLLYIR